jgi:hypothetical protein
MNRLRNLAKRASLATIITGMLLAAGVAFAAWTATGSGNGYAQAKGMSAVTLGDASTYTTAQLYPGGTGDLVLRVTNPNSYDVTVTTVTGTGPAITAPTNATCDASTGVSFTNQSGLSGASYLVPGGGTATITLTGAVSMSSASVNACKGLTFTVPVSVTAQVG